MFHLKIFKHIHCIILKKHDFQQFTPKSPLKLVVECNHYPSSKNFFSDLGML